MEALPATDCAHWTSTVDPDGAKDCSGAIATLADFPVLDATVQRVIALCDDEHASTADLVDALDHLEVAQAPERHALVPFSEGFGEQVELLELPAALVELDHAQPLGAAHHPAQPLLDALVRGKAGRRSHDDASARRSATDVRRSRTSCDGGPRDGGHRSGVPRGRGHERREF
jgi:hypothetical protein